MKTNCIEKFAPGISPEGFYCDFHYIINNDPIGLSDRIVNGEMVVNLGLPSVESVDLSEVWRDDCSVKSNTFRLYLMSLSCIVPLSLAYKKTGEIQYSDYIYKVIKSWDEYRKKEFENSYIWYDHSVAMRTEHLIYYYVLCNKTFDGQMCGYIINLINENSYWLYDDKNYCYKHNHGVIEDEALLYSSYFFGTDKSEWTEKAISRLRDQIDYAFDSEGIHVENSTNYQMGIMKILKSIEKLLIDHNNSFSAEIEKTLMKATRFMMHITKPNGHHPMIGDSLDDSDGYKVNYGVMEFGDDEYTYAATLGKKGKIPKQKHACFFNGYYIARGSWEREKYEDNTWKCFKAGYYSKTHKHADDNSILLYARGYDIFVDPGFYNYMPGNRYSSYLRSSCAHNTLTVDEKSYSVTEANSRKCGIYDFIEDKNYCHIVGYNNQYGDVLWDRHFYDLGDCMIIYDDVVAKKDHSYSQFFHMSKYMNLIECSEKECVFRIAETDYYVRIRQCGKGENTIYRGDKNKIQYGYLSQSFNNIESIYTIRSCQVGRNINYITVISIENSNGEIDDIHKIGYNAEKMFFSVSGTKEDYSIPLKAREREDVSSVKIINKRDNVFSFINTREADNTGSSYCWYVIKESTAEVIYRSEWSKKSCFEFDFKDKENCLVKAYIKSGNNRYRDSYMVACIGMSEGKAQNITDKRRGLNLVFNGHYYEKIGDHTYRFYVNFDYMWKWRIVWYIYKNGGSYDYKQTNERFLEYSFKEPGSYAVLYYLKTANGDDEYWSFDAIEIT